MYFSILKNSLFNGHCEIVMKDITDAPGSSQPAAISDLNTLIQLKKKMK